MSQPSMSDVHVPTLLKVVRRRKRRKKKLKKHMGPGAHPSGTEQDVHGRGRQRRSLTSSESEHISTRRREILTRIDELADQRSALGSWRGEPGRQQYVVEDMETYDRLEREQDRLRSEYSTIGEGADYDPVLGIESYAGSLTSEQITAVQRRLSAIDASRRRLLDRMEAEQSAHANQYVIDESLYDLQEKIDALDLEEGELLIALTTPTLPGMETGIKVATPTDKPVKSASGKLSGIIHDYATADDPTDVHAIFEAELEINGETYQAVVEDVGSTGDDITVYGKIYYEGEEVGKFYRVLEDGTTVWNHEFYINDQYQGKGIGTMLLSHWETELASAGYQEMKVTAADVGRYAWAVAGYEFEYGYENIIDNLLEYARDYNEDIGLDPEDFETDSELQDPDWRTIREMAYNWMEYQEVPSPWEIAMVGAGSDFHIGKEILLSDGMWNGTKDITY